MLPPLPSWDGLHPLIIHFPIALLIVAPLLILIGIFTAKRGKAFLISALILMVIGTTATFIAVSTGEAAGELAERVPNVEAVLESHEELAETTRTVFSILTVVFGIIVLAPMAFRKELSSRVTIPLNLAFLLFYSSGVVMLINTAHEGGKLVHQYGVHAMMASSGQSVTGSVSTDKKSDDDNDD